MPPPPRRRSLVLMRNRLLFVLVVTGLLALAVGGWTVQGMRWAFNHEPG
jgi:hypothetical protein